MRARSDSKLELAMLPLKATVFQIASETAVAELTDFHSRFAFGVNAFGVLWAAS